MVKQGSYGQIQAAEMKYFLPENSMKQQIETLHFQGSTEDHIIFLLEIKMTPGKQKETFQGTESKSHNLFV